MAALLQEETRLGATASTIAAESAGTSGPWPLTWPERARMLERQHDRLEALLAELLLAHGPDQPSWNGAEALALDRSCRRLLWDLRLHLRLEERWLEAAGALCSGHRAAHQDARDRAQAGFIEAGGERSSRHHWLLSLHSWFASHRQGPDALAYARAGSPLTLEA